MVLLVITVRSAPTAKESAWAFYGNRCCSVICRFIAAVIATAATAATLLLLLLLLSLLPLLSTLFDVAATDTPMSVHLHVFVHHFLDCVVVTNQCDARFSLYRNVVPNQLLIQ